MRAALRLCGLLPFCPYVRRRGPVRSADSLRSRPTARRERCLAARLTQRLRPSDVVLQHSARAKFPWRRASSYIADRQDGPAVAHPVLFSPRDPGPLVGTRAEQFQVTPERVVERQIAEKHLPFADEWERCRAREAFREQVEWREGESLLAPGAPRREEDRGRLV